MVDRVGGVLRHRSLTLFAVQPRNVSLVCDLVEQGAEAILLSGSTPATARKLVKLAESYEKPTFHIETAEELNIYLGDSDH